MNRRQFLGRAAGAGALATGLAGNELHAAGPLHSEASSGTFPVARLKELREQYRYDLFDDYLPFIYKHVVDHEYGGFMCNTDRKGRNITQNKRTWYEGRGIWVHSFLHNHLDQDPIHLEVARKSVEFILKHKPEGDRLFPHSFTREGQVLEPEADGIYGDLFVANGLQEYARAARDDSYWDLAKEILLKCMRIYDSPDYRYAVSYGPEAPSVPAPRVLGHWMVLIRLATQMLEKRADPEVERIASRCVDAIMDSHFNPEFDLINEVLNHDLSRPDSAFAQFVYTGHAIETLWMLLFEGARRKDKALFDLTSERFKRHIEVAWDDVYQGVFRSLDHVDNNIWKVDKVLWAQEEVLIGTLFIVEHRGAQWASEWFERMYAYVQDKFPLKQYGYPLWILGADRKVTFQEEFGRVGNFHHPRHLMLNLLSLDRMIERGGGISDLFS